MDASEPLKVLFLAANPASTTRLALDEEIRAITEKIQLAEARDRVQVVHASAVRPDDLLQQLNQHRPHVVHFSGHGSAAGELILVDNQGQAKPVSTAALQALFRTLRDNIRLVLLNACYSRVQGEAIAQEIDFVVGMTDRMGDISSRVFAAAVYRALAFHRSVQEAFDQAHTALLLEGSAYEDRPQLLVRRGADATTVLVERASRAEPHAERAREEPTVEAAPAEPRPLEEVARTQLSGTGAVAPAQSSGPGARSVPTVIFHVPHARNPDFTGRDDLLQQVERALASDASTPVLQAVYGLGGVGKTQTAVEYAYRHREDYDLVWWVQAEDQSSLAADYAGLALELDLLDLETPGQLETVATVRSWLEQSDRRWLLVFDNVREYDEIAPYLPRRGQGCVLVTSRTREWPRVVQRLEVNVLSKDEAVAFLVKRTGQDDSAGAMALAEAVGYLPLALEQAAAYIDARELTYSTYLARFRVHREELLGWGKLPDYPATVATTWQFSFAATVAQAPAADPLLTLLAFLAPEAIPLDLLAAHAAVLPEPLSETMADAIELDEAVATLRRYSLVEIVNEDTLSVHRLVQDVVRERLDDEASRNWATAAVAVLTAAFPDDPEEPATWPTCARLVAHAEAVAGNADRAAGAHSTIGVLLNRMGRYLSTQAVFAQARTAFERALAIRERTLPADHPDIAESLNGLGLVLQGQGNYAGAKERYEHALAIDERVHGPDHPSVATALSNLGLVLQDQADYAGAKQRYERALAIDERVYGPDHPSVATDLSNLGSVLQDQGDYAGAKQRYERALAIREAVHGPDHPSVATALINLAGVANQMGETIIAARLIWRSLLILRQQPTTLVEGTGYFQLAEIAASLGRVDAGLRLLATTYAIDRQLGHDYAEAIDLPAIHREATTLDLSQVEVDGLLAEVADAYRTDRGHGLVAAAFPELSIDTRLLE